MPPKKGKTSNRKPTEWQKLVTQVRASHPKLPLKEVLKIAKEKYHNKNQSGGLLQPQPFPTARRRIPRLPGQVKIPVPRGPPIVTM